jgi:hypothetical protein
MPILAPLSFQSLGYLGLRAEQSSAMTYSLGGIIWTVLRISRTTGRVVETLPLVMRTLKMRAAVLILEFALGHRS